MYRRRRSTREKIPFGFDSFLDVVANVIGIIIRLILVAWVGARAYTAAMLEKEEREPIEHASVQVEGTPVRHEAPPPAETGLAAPESPNPLEEDIAKAKKEIDQARSRLVAYLDQLDRARAKTAALRAGVADLKKEHIVLTSRIKAEESAGAALKGKVDLDLLSLDRLKERSQEALAQIKKLEKEPIPKKLLRYRTPVSRVVEGEELMFECRAGRVAFIDVAAFMHEIQDGISDDKIRDIARLKTWSGTTSEVGSFRVRFTFESTGGLFSTPGSVHIQLTQWTVEPTALVRGETEAEALRAGSEFRRIVDRLDPNHTTVTFWVYPDSFALFRALRDHIYEGGVEVAGRPLPEGHPIGASIHGTRSRGQ
ncbi:MAG: hypothetical protein U0793_31265 [Gemmataceae bacterium]